MGRAVRFPTICQPGLQTLAHWFIVYGMDERNCLHREGLNLDALLGHILDASDRITNYQRKLQQATRAVHN